jgi:hypothetical protein
LELEESTTVVNGDAWFWLMIHHANVREGAADHKPPLQRRATWERRARAPASEIAGERDRQGSPTNWERRNGEN